MALLFLLHDFVKRYARSDIKLLAVTVDHDLRAESAAEAQQVSDLCASHGIAHRITTWDTAKPSTGISEAARSARQKLLADAAIEADTDLILLAHTADDQAETIQMRMRRGDGRGLAGIAPATLYDNRVWFMRPLLDLGRSELRSYLALRGVPWIDDPTNKDMRFERPRVRQDLLGRPINGLLRIAADAARERERLGGVIADVMRKHLCLSSPGLLQFPEGVLREMERDAAIYLLRVLLAVSGGASHLPDQQRSSDLLDRMLTGCRRATLSRAVISARREHLYLHREQRDLPSSPFRDGVMWDRRYRIVAPKDTEACRISALGSDAALQFDPNPSLPKGVARAAFAAEPALWLEAKAGGGGGICPGAVVRTPVLGPWATLVPSFDYEAASALAEILGAGKLLKRPWQGHKEG